MGKKTGPKPQTWEICIEKLQDNSYLDPVTDCFVWTGGHLTGQMGYGAIRCDNREYSIHRLVYERMVNINVPKVVMHTCDNPKCWNPKHLKGGTHQDNADDKVAKQRQCRGVHRYNAKLNPAAILDIRQSDLTPVELGLKYSVSRATIHRALKGNTWKHISTRSCNRLTEIESEGLEW